MHKRLEVGSILSSQRTTYRPILCRARDAPRRRLEMRAVQVTRFGGPEGLRLTQLDRPEPISTEVLVRVIAAGVNPVDCKTRRGDGVARWVGPPPFVPGWDVCGVVESTGYGVTRFKVGDTVYGMPRFPRQAGAYAEYVSAPSHQFAAIPTNITPI